MLMHAALPGTQHLNDSKSARAPLLGVGHSTELHQLPPSSLDIEHSTLIIRDETGTKQGQRIPTSCSVLGFGKSLGNSCCVSRQNLCRRSLLPWEPSLALCRGATTCPWGTALPRAAFLLPRAQRLLWSPCLAGHWPGVAPAGDTAPMPDPCRTCSPFLLGLEIQWKGAKKTFP